MGVTEHFGKLSQLSKILRMLGEVLFITSVVDRLKSLFLRNKGSLDDIANLPVPLSELLIPLTLSGEAALKRPCFP